MDVESLLSELKRSAEAAPVEEKAVDPVTVKVKHEIEVLQERIKKLQDTLQEKTKEIQTIKEHILVTSGALQAMNHVLKITGKEEAGPSSLE